jgi:hypothetical protein
MTVSALSLSSLSASAVTDTFLGVVWLTVVGDTAAAGCSGAVGDVSGIPGVVVNAEVTEGSADIAGDNADIAGDSADIAGDNAAGAAGKVFRRLRTANDKASFSLPS